MGAEDWSYVLQQVPGSMAFLGTRPAGIAPAEVAPNHSNRMVIDEGAMATGIALYSGVALRWLAERSEEHTSELQSLMRISYAVFCLKKKKKNIIQSQRQQPPAT